MYDPKRGRVIYSRDVLFEESSHGIEKEITGEEKHCVQLDCFSDKENVVENAEEPGLRRSQRERCPPNYFGERATLADSKMNEPVTVKEALSRPDKEKWWKAMEKEMESLHANDVWDLVELPANREVVGSKWA